MCSAAMARGFSDQRFLVVVYQGLQVMSHAFERGRRKILSRTTTLAINNASS